MTTENWIAVAAVAVPVISIMLRMLVIQSRSATAVAESQEAIVNLLVPMKTDLTQLRELHLVKGNLCALQDGPERRALIREVTLAARQGKPA